jgi:hypothetical protein
VVGGRGITCSAALFWGVPPVGHGGRNRVVDFMHACEAREGGGATILFVSAHFLIV